MLVALAAVWFIVFLPSVGKKNRDKDDASRDRRERRQKLTANSSPQIASRVAKANNAKRVLLTAAGVAAVATFVAVFQGSILGAGIGLAAVVSFAVVARIASLRANSAIVSGARRRGKLPAGIVGEKVETYEDEEFFDDRAWRPNELPEQAYKAQVGTLENPTLADVVNIEFPRELDSETLDEILRRRRAN
jgi:hypothetical protein